jgi:hypothetical protein
MADPRRSGLGEVLAYFQEFEDPRSSINREHPLASVVVVASIAVLAGASGPTAIARWAALKEGPLEAALPLPNGVPGEDVSRRVLMASRPGAFQACLAAWVRALRDEAATTGVERPTLAVDGKTPRRSHDRKDGLGPPHAVGAWASEYGPSPGQVACDEKSDEITAVPALPKLVGVAGAVITIAAMGCQEGIVEAIVAAKGDYVPALKGDQGTLHRAVVDHALKRWDDDVAGETIGRRQVEETGHGRR